MPGVGRAPAPLRHLEPNWVLGSPCWASRAPPQRQPAPRLPSGVGAWGTPALVSRSPGTLPPGQGPFLSPHDFQWLLAAHMSDAKAHLVWPKPQLAPGPAEYFTPQGTPPPGSPPEPLRGWCPQSPSLSPSRNTGLTADSTLAQVHWGAGHVTGCQPQAPEPRQAGHTLSWASLDRDSALALPQEFYL